MRPKKNLPISPAAEGSSPPRQAVVSLHLSNDLADFWEILLPWFEAVAGSLAALEPCAVVTPSRSLSYLLRSELLERNLSFLGLRFLSPAQLRATLLPAAQNIPLRENLRLLLAATAEEIVAQETLAAGAETSEALIAKSIARDPNQFLRTIDQLSAAGWSLEEIEEPIARTIAQRFERLVHACGLQLVHEADRGAADAAASTPPVFDRLLILGFDGAHWPLWPLLRAAALAASSAAVILNSPREEARDLDETWIGTWEESFGEAQPIPASDRARESALELLQHLPETPAEIDARAENPVAHIHFLVGRDTPEQAKAIIALAAQFLRGDSCSRVGILFPRHGALPRMVARFLEAARIAHNDGLAHLGPSPLHDDAWQAWLALQSSPRLDSLLQFLRASPANLFDNISLDEAADILQRAYGEVLIDRFELLREFCARQPASARHAATLAGLDKVRFLSASATLSEFVKENRAIFAQLGWKQHASEIDRLSRGWSEQISLPLSRSLYLRWLEEILGAPSRQRDDFGSHPYSRVQLLPYAEAEGQTWSHLIFAGLNEDDWPALDDELTFVREQAIEEFNRRNRILNRRATKSGRHGEGQTSVREGKTLLLGARERRQIRQRQLANLIEAATHGVGVTANLYSAAAPSRIANPSEMFSRLYFAARGGGVSQRTLQALEMQTRNWLHAWSPLDAQKIDSISLGRTRYAYNARRQKSRVSEFEFALRQPPAAPISLRVTQWEEALRYPAIAWMRLFLGVEAAEDSGKTWASSTGQWVHRWLADGVGHPGDNSFVPVPERAQVRERLSESAYQFRREIESLCASCGETLPDWWISGWGNALYLADTFAWKFSALSGWSRLAAEWKLDSPTIIPLADDRSLRVRGRIDLLLGKGAINEGALGFPEVWIIDYKTGHAPVFDRRANGKAPPEERFRKQLVDGRGVQLALYALAAHALGAQDASLTMLIKNGDLSEQFTLADALAQKDFWHALHEMQENGVFGMLGQVHTSFGFGRTYPLATLPIDVELLREKWELTHPALATETEERDDD